LKNKGYRCKLPPYRLNLKVLGDSFRGYFKIMKLFGQTEASSKQKDSYYWQYFGLLRDPFLPEIEDPSSAYISPTWEEHLDLLQHWLNHQNKLIAFIAPKGIGKTTFSQVFLSQVFETSYIYTLDGSSTLTLQKLMALLHEKFAIDEQPYDSLEETLDYIINQIQFKDKICLLLIDDAQELPDETIDALIYLIKQQSVNQMNFHPVVFGDVELQTKLAKVARDELNRDFLQTLELEPFSLEDTRRYILHRLVKAGLREPMPLSNEAIERIYEMTEGNPENINLNTPEFMVDKLDRQTASLSPSFLQRYQTHLIGSGVILVFLVIVGFMFARPSANSPKKMPVQASNVPSLSFDIQNGQTTLNASSNQNPPPTNPIQANPPKLAVASVQTPKPPLPTTVAANSNPTPPTTTKNAPITPASNTAPLVASQADNSAPALAVATTSSASVTQTTTAPVTPPADTINTPASSAIPKETKPDELSNSPIDHDVIAGKVKAKEKTPKEKELHHHKNTTTDDKKKTSTKNKEKSIAAMNDRHYTLQLIALSSKEAANKFIQKNNLSGKSHSFTRKTNNKTLFVVVYGSYPSQQAAKQAISNLPKALQASAWPKKIATIKKETAI
jgi:DamX protein